MYSYCNFYCSPAGSDPPLFLGWRRHWGSHTLLTLLHTFIVSSLFSYMHVLWSWCVWHDWIKRYLLLTYLGLTGERRSITSLLMLLLLLPLQLLLPPPGCCYHCCCYCCKWNECPPNLSPILFIFYTKQIGKHGYFCCTPTGLPDDISGFYYFFLIEDMPVMCLSLVTKCVCLKGKELQFFENWWFLWKSTSSAGLTFLLCSVAPSRSSKPSNILYSIIYIFASVRTLIYI